MSAERVPFVVVAFPKEKVHFFHLNWRLRRVKSLKCFAGYSLGTRRLQQQIFRPPLKSLKNAAGVDARDIFAFAAHIHFGHKIAQMLHSL